MLITEDAGRFENAKSFDQSLPPSKLPLSPANEGEGEGRKGGL